MTLTPEQIAAGWIAHDGGECPVDKWRPVQIILRKGNTVYHPDSRYLDWEHSIPDDLRHPTDIIVYRPETSNG